MFLLAGLFVLIYVMVFAGTLIAEVFRRGVDSPGGVLHYQRLA